MFIPPPPASDLPPERQTKPIRRDTDADCEEIGEYVLDCLNHGSKPADIRKSLVARGLSESDAKAVVNQMLHLHTGGAQGHDYCDLEAVRAQGRRNMAIGGVVCVIGLLVTIGSMAAAGGRGGGIIAWGAILWGGIQFVRGMSQANQT